MTPEQISASTATTDRSAVGTTALQGWQVSLPSPSSSAQLTDSLIQGKSLVGLLLNMDIVSKLKETC